MISDELKDELEIMETQDLRMLFHTLVNKLGYAVITFTDIEAKELWLDTYGDTWNEDIWLAIQEHPNWLCFSGNNEVLLDTCWGEVLNILDEVAAQVGLA